MRDCDRDREGPYGLSRMDRAIILSFLAGWLLGAAFVYALIAGTSAG